MSWSFRLPPPGAAVRDPFNGSATCRLTYIRFHQLFTIPLALALWVLARPFLTRLDRVKLLLLPCIALAWTTAWDSALIRAGAWTYPRKCVWKTVWLVPVEEYFFIVIQSVIITLFTTLTTRWLLVPAYLFTAPSKGGSLFTAGGVAGASMLTLSAAGTAMLWLSPTSHTYYMSMIVWWATLPLALLLWGTAGFILRIVRGAAGGPAGLRSAKAGRRNALLLVATFALPTAFLWKADVFAMRRGTWHITARTSLGVFPIPDLPIEEALFFVATNWILLAASLTFDRVIGICRFAEERVAPATPAKGAARQPPYSTTYLPLNASSIRALWLAFISSDELSDSPASAESRRRVDTLRTSIAVLSKASRSFTAASFLLPWDLRADLCGLYAFCRASDNLIDEKVAAAAEGQGVGATKQRRLKGLRRVLDVAYDTSSSRPQQLASIRQLAQQLCREEGAEPDSASAQAQVYAELQAVSGALLEFTHILPRRLWEELFEGYEMDVRMEEQQQSSASGLGFLETMDDLERYGQCVAGSIGEMCTRIVLHRAGLIPDLAPASAAAAAKGEDRAEGMGEYDSVVRAARRMGVALQFVNIARDVGADAKELRRCYLPRSMIGEDLLREVSDSLSSSDATSQASTKALAALRPHAIQVLDLAQQYYSESYPAISKIPIPAARSGLRVACAVYADIASAIRRQSADDVGRGTRAKSTNARRAWIAFKTLYLP